MRKKCKRMKTALLFSVPERRDFRGFAAVSCPVRGVGHSRLGVDEVDEAGMPHAADRPLFPGVQTGRSQNEAENTFACLEKNKNSGTLIPTLSIIIRIQQTPICRKKRIRHPKQRAFPGTAALRKSGYPKSNRLSATGNPSMTRPIPPSRSRGSKGSWRLSTSF